MSFVHDCNEVTLENYSLVFRGYPVDILDEIRSAVLDNTPISPYIDVCINDSYKLGQIRLALRELISKSYLCRYMTGRTVWLIRSCTDADIDISSILQYIRGSNLLIEPSTMEKILEFMYIGIDLSKIDFTEVNVGLVDVVCQGVSQGCPLWLLVPEINNMDESMVEVLIRGMQLGLDSTLFMDRSWDRNILYLIFSYSTRIDIVAFVTSISNRFSYGVVRCLLDLALSDLDYKLLCVKCDDGLPLYNKFQIAELSLALKSGVLVSDMLNPTLSDLEMRSMRTKLQSKNLSVSNN